MSTGSQPLDPFRALDFDAACGVARTEEKLVLIDFFTTWCEPCKRLDELTWTAEPVRAWLAQETVALKIDAERDTALAERFRIKSYPSVVLVQPNGTELGCLRGFRDPDRFLEEANDILRGLKRVDRLRQQIEQSGMNNPNVRSDYADELAHEGRHAEALEHYLWCFDHGNEHAISYGGVRLSFLLSNIVGLGREYPVALAELRTRRDAARETLLNGLGDSRTASDFQAINHYLGESNLTLELYDALADVPSKLGRENPRNDLFRKAFDLLSDARRYADLLAGIGSPRKHFERELGMHLIASSYSDWTEEESRKHRVRRVESMSRVYEALLGCGRDSEAAEFLQRIVAFEPSDAARAILAERARRTGRVDLALAIEHPSTKGEPEPDTLRGDR